MSSHRDILMKKILFLIALVAHATRSIQRNENIMNIRFEEAAIL